MTFPANSSFFKLSSKASDCPNKKSLKKKAMQAITWDESSSDESSSSDDDVNATALIAQDSTFMCLASTHSISMSSLHEKFSTESSTDEESEEEDMAVAYHQLVIESKKSGETQQEVETKIKAMQAITWDESSSDESSSSDDDVNATALIAQDSTFMCLASTHSISMSSLHEKFSTESSTDEESEEEDMAVAYHQLVIESKESGETQQEVETKIV
ncbi:protein gar2-like [Ananas comosus]|uniref:Protein gar2-like n=1 Tax=Ananas comosus TaxID=4615 RepID=A0A6P5FH30_ANACO|nr:protein gar2-like [Ananas comosus]